MPRVETHSAMAFLTFCLPVGLITYWVFQCLVKTPVLEVLPEGPMPAGGLSRRRRIYAARVNGCWRPAGCWGEP